MKFFFLFFNQIEQYLHEQGLFPISGARAFLVVKDDIERLLKSDEYLNAPSVNGKEISNGFTLPNWIVMKIKSYMDKLKLEREKLAKPGARQGGELINGTDSLIE